MKTPLSLSIAIAYLVSRRRQTVISVLGVAMGVGFFILVASMMQGFHDYFINKVIDVAPHVLMKDEFRAAPEQPALTAHPNAAVELHGVKPKEERRGIRGWERIVRELARQPGLAAAPSLRGQAFLRYGSREIAASVIGIEPREEARVSNIEKDLVSGSLQALLTHANGVILGSGLANNLGAHMGSKLMVVSPRGVTMVMKVVGILRTGITDIDYAQAFVLLKKSQILEQRDRRVNTLKMRLEDVDRAAETAALIEAEYGYRTEGWQEANENVFSLFRVQNMIMYSVVTAILIVAGFGIYNVISTVINEKVRDIAILKSIGFGQRDIEHIFILQGIVLGLLGTLAGWAVGYVLVEMFSQVKFDMGDEGFISTTTLILSRSPSYYGIAAVLAVLSAALSAFLPARRAARLHPVDIIRSAA